MLLFSCLAKIAEVAVEVLSIHVSSCICFENLLFYFSWLLPFKSLMTRVLTDIDQKLFPADERRKATSAPF